MSVRVWLSKSIRYHFIIQGYIFWPFPRPLGVGGFFLSQLKKREEFEGLEKRKKRGGGKKKKGKSDKIHV